MAADKSGQVTFPVWVGSLKDTVSERDLRKLFAKHGPIASVKLMKDNRTGKSKGFGWVNFLSRSAAETSAVKMAGYVLCGFAIKTAGPSELEKKGLFSPQKKNYRPLTDCSFFIQGKHCKNGDACEYRHSERALLTEEVCPAWQRKQCNNLHCPRRHPSTKESSRRSTSSAGSPTPEAGVGGAVQVCGGRCGDLSCSLSFSSVHTLNQHIQLGQLQCKTCKIVFGSQAELREHRKVCSRSHNDSTSTTTPSPSQSDVEVLSDSDSIASEDSYKPSPPNRGNSPSPVKSRSDAHIPGDRGQKRRGRRGKKASKSESSENITQVVTQKRSKLPSEATLVTSSSSPAFHGTLHYSPLGLGEDDMGAGNVSFNVGSDSSDYSDDEEDLTYTSAEMAQLLSLNELDMHPYTGSSESEEEVVESEGEDTHKVLEGREEGDTGRKKRQRNKKKKGQSGGAKGDTSVTHDRRSPLPHHRSPAMSRQPEPVGLFWDIENCSVPLNKSAFGVAAKMRRVFFEGKREAEFMVVCDITKERKEITDSLNKAQVTLVHVNAVAKNAADDKLRQSLRRFAHTYPAPSTVVLVSSDVNFSSELNDLRHVHNMSIVLVHSRFTSDALKVFAHQLVDYEQFLEDVEAPKGAQRPLLPNVLLVTNLPKNFPPKKLSSRLGQLSDNCGGRVLGVDPTSGTARILFRSPEWAMKAEKRMKGEDVFGSKINLCLDYSAPPQRSQPPPPLAPPTHPLPPPMVPPTRPPPPPGPLLPPPMSPVFRNLSGPALGHTFPPAARPPINHPPMQTPPPHQRFRPPLLPPAHNFPQPGAQYVPPPNTRLPRPPPPQSPKFPPSPPQPSGPPQQFPYSHIAATPAPRPEGKILIFKIPPRSEANSFSEVDRLVLTTVLEACIKTEPKRVVMWHTFSEIQVLLRVDFHQTAVVRKDELIKRLWEKGDLKANVAKQFVEQCVKSLTELCNRKRLTWQATSCGWTEDEEADRLTRSQVIALLQQFSNVWVNWNRFKNKYNKIYHSGLSEMAVHTACKGAVMILGKEDNNKSQVIIRYEMSPLVRISSQKKVCDGVLNKVIGMLSTRQEHRLKLLDVVKEYTNEVGPLPLSANGKPLQEVLSRSPRLQFVGSKPSSIYLMLVNAHIPPPEKTTVPPPLPQRGTSNLEMLSTEFRHLLMKQAPNCELPLFRLQQEYQTFYHRSFRVCDFLPTGEGAKMKNLVEACTGINLKDVRLPNNKVETIVYLESEARTSISNQAQPTPPDTVADCERRVHDLLCSLPNYQITLDRFMGEYEKMYGSKMDYYGHSKLTSLLESFSSTLTISEDRGPSRLVQLKPIHILRHELTLLLSDHGGQMAINQIVPEYKEKFGRMLVVTQFGFPKLIRALEAMPDTVDLVGKGPSRIAILKKTVPPRAVNSKQFEDEVTALLESTHNQRLSVIELTKAYNEVFRNQAHKKDVKLPPISEVEMVETLRKMPRFSISGAGPVQYVNLVQQNEKKKKEKTTASQKQPSEIPPTEQAPPPNPQHTEILPPPQQPSTAPTDPVKSQPPLLPLTTPEPPVVSLSGSGAVEGGSNLPNTTKEESSLLRLGDKESQRLASETQRLLQCHHEHAMTVSELVQSFKEAEDPASPQPEELNLCLHKHNVRRGGPQAPRIFQISSIPGSVGDSLIQLNRLDCYGKLAFDLLYLFTYQPTPTLTLPVDHMDILYQQCNGHKFIPAVYGVKTLQGVIEVAKPVSQLMKLDETKQYCSLTPTGCRRAMSSLLVELLFLRGQECHDATSDLPQLFQQHFGFPLPLAHLGVDSPVALLSLPEIKNCIQVTDNKPELRNVTRFAEQLRFLLTQNNGRLSLDSLQGLYISAFGPPPDTHGKDWLNTKLVHYAPHVVNLSSHKWAVWAPAGRPYPVRNISSNLPPPSPSHGFLQHGGAGSQHHKPTTPPLASDWVIVDGGVFSGVRENESQLGQGQHPGPSNSTKSSPIASKPLHGIEHSTISPSSCNSLSKDTHPLPTTREKEACKTGAASLPQPMLLEQQTEVKYEESPYDFLQNDPQLLAQMTIKEEDNVPSTADALQKLVEAGKQVLDFELPDIPNLPPPLFPLPANDESHQKVPDIPVDGSADYLKAGLKPDEVLQELYRVKEHGGGIINPSSMEPFLNYFGELSSRELERLESQEAKPKSPTPSPTPTKGMLRKKRMMAIRFPGQDPELDPELQKTLDSIQLPEIQSLSDDSDDSDTCPEPVSRAELLAELMEKEFFTCPEKNEEDSNKAACGGQRDTTSFLPRNGGNMVGTSVDLVPESELGHLSKPSFLPCYYDQGKNGQQ